MPPSAGLSEQPSFNILEARPVTWAQEGPMTLRLFCVVLFLLLSAPLVQAQSLKDILKSY